MANLIESVGEQVVNAANTVRGEIDKFTLKPTYQSPLEAVGIAMREATKPLRYYGKQYPYATPIQTDYINATTSYIAVSGWRPSRYDLKLDIHDKEFESIQDEFEIQGSGNFVHRVNNQAQSQGTVMESYGRNNNYEANTRDSMYISNVGTQPTAQY